MTTRTRILAGSLLPLLLVAVAACGGSSDGPGVASVGGTTAPAASATPTRSILEQGLRYARCMRENGVPWPDPLVDGDSVRLQGAGKDVDAAVLAKATEACKPFEVVIGQADQDKKAAKSIEFARCMREHGVENYPDPKPDGADGDVAQSIRDDPQYPEAKTTCTAHVRSYEPTPGAKK